MQRGLKPAKSRIPIIAPAAIAGLLTFLAYVPSLGYGFVHWDDDFYVYENLKIRSMNPAFFKWTFTSSDVANYHPLSTISHALDYAVWGLNPFGHHLASAVFHALNASLVYILATRLDPAAKTENFPARAVITGLTAALIFGLHPLRVESVSWVSERKDVLCAFFFLLSALSYLDYAREPFNKARRYLLTLVYFLLSLLSKPMAVTLPFVLFILDFYPLKRIVTPGLSKTVILEKIPFFVLSASSVFLTLQAQSRGGAVVALATLPLPGRAAIAVQAYAFYLYKTLLPIGLAPFYPHPLPQHLFNHVFIISSIVILAVTLCCAIYAAKERAPLAAWLYYIVTLLPVVGFVQAGGQAAADRYTYLPGISLALLAGAGAGVLYGKVAQRRIMTAGAALVLCVLAAMTIRQERIWKDTITLFTHEINRYPERVFVAYNNRGIEYEKRGEYASALRDFSRAAVNNAYYAEPYINRGALYIKIGRDREALEDFNRAIALDPGNPAAYLGRGNADLKAGSFAEALVDFKKTAELDPESTAAFYGIGNAYLGLNDRESAAYYFRKAALSKARAQ